MERTSSSKILKISSLGVFFLFIIIYAIFGSHNLIFGVKIKKVSMDGVPLYSGAKVDKSVIKITGNAENATNLTLNGREISVNEAGDFDETIALLIGYNVVNITAKDKFGYIDEKNYKIIYAAGNTF